MKTYDREHYKLKEYVDEEYILEINDDKLRISKTEHSENWEELYMKAKKEAKDGKYCTISEIKWRFIP